MTEYEDMLDELHADDSIGGEDDAAGADDDASQSGLDLMRDHFQVEDVIETMGDDLPEDDAALVEMLRGFPGAEAFDDATLLKMWNETADDETKAEVGTASGDDAAVGDDAWSPVGWSAAIEGEPVNFEEVLLKDFLEKGELTYKALGKDQVRGFNEVVRNAQLGHFNEQRYGTLQQDLVALGERYAEIQEELQGYKEMENLWMRALKDENVMNQLKSEMAPMLMGEIPELEAPMSQQELEAQGYQIFDQEIRPYLSDVSTYYGIDQISLEQYVMEQISMLPDAIITEERVVEYLQNQLFHEIEAAGYNPLYDEEGKLIEEQESNMRDSIQTAQNIDAKSAEENTALKQEVDQLKAVVKNLQTQTKVGKKKKAPPNTRGGKGPSGGDDGDSKRGGDQDFDSAADFKDWLRE
jgi:hypothetical protein